MRTNCPARSREGGSSSKDSSGLRRVATGIPITAFRAARGKHRVCPGKAIENGCGNKALATPLRDFITRSRAALLRFRKRRPWDLIPLAGISRGRMNLSVRNDFAAFPISVERPAIVAGDYTFGAIVVVGRFELGPQNGNGLQRWSVPRRQRTVSGGLEPARLLDVRRLRTEGVPRALAPKGAIE